MVLSKVYTSCPKLDEWDKSNMSCNYDTMNSPITFRDSMDFKTENAHTGCGQTWQDPMQVFEMFLLSDSAFLK